MKKYQLLWLAVPVSVFLPFVIPGCAGTLTDAEKAELGGPNGTSSGSAGSSGTGTMDCAEAVFAKTCSPGDTVAKCVTCSGISGCHGKDLPILKGLDLSADGIADKGASLLNKPADATMDGVCGPGADPPVTGKLLVDGNNPENSLLYQKVLTGYITTPGFCGSRMPFAATKALTTDQQACILAWIKRIPGVNANGAGAGGAGGAGGSGGSAGGASGSGGAGGSGGSGMDAGKAGSGGGATDAGKG